MPKIHHTRFPVDVELSCQVVVVMEFGIWKRYGTTDLQHIFAHLLRNCRLCCRLVSSTAGKSDLLRGNWCNGYRPLLSTFWFSIAAAYTRSIQGLIQDLPRLRGSYSECGMQTYNGVLGHSPQQGPGA